MAIIAIFRPLSSFGIHHCCVSSTFDCGLQLIALMCLPQSTNAATMHQWIVYDRKPRHYAEDNRTEFSRTHW